MPNTCSIKLTVDKLPKIINKIEFFMFRAMEQKGIDFYKISQQPKTVESIDVLNKIREGEYTREQLDGLVGKKFTSLLMTAANLEDENKIGKNIYQIAQMVHLFDTIKNSLIPSYITDYAENSKISEEQGDKEQAEDYKTFATNLQSLITMWDQVAPNFLRYSDIFNVKAKFTLNDDMLVDLNDIADDEKKMANKMVFDKPANEIDPIDDIDQAIELFIRSIPLEDMPDEYGFTSSVNYASLVRQMFTDLQNSIGMDEIMKKLDQNKEKVPAYKYLLDKLQYKPGMTRAESQFRINFRNSFVKAFVPIFITSIEQVKGSKNIFKVTEAASGKTNLYERIIGSNFALRGMPVITNKETGETTNLAHEDDGVWKLDATDIPKIQNYLEKFPLGEGGFRSVEFLKGLGFEFSEATEKKYIQEFSEIERKNATREKKYNSKVDYIKEHLFSILLEKPFVLNPIKEIKKDLYSEKEKTEEGYSKRLSKGQNNVIADIVAEELKNNLNYNIEKSVITAEGTRMHAIQLHNNFTVLNKYLSDPEAFPRLQDIIDNEPSMFWLDPEVNPAIRKSLFLNSLFFFDPTDETVDKDGNRRYGKRRRVTKKFIDNKNSYVYSSTEGEFVKINLVNTGGLQLKLDGEFGKEGSSSTSLNEFDKILQDLHNFMPNKKSFNSMLRLGDKSTDLGVGLNYSLDVTTGEPAVYYIQGQPILSTKPLAAVPDNADAAIMVRNPVFLTNVTNALEDFIGTRFLGKQGFYKDLTNASKNILSTWGYFDGILTSKTKNLIDTEIDNQINSENPDLSNLDNILEGDVIKEAVEKDIIDYFTKTADTFYSKILAVKNKLGVRDEDLVGSENLYGKNLHAQLNSFVLNNFISDLEQMKVFFGDAIYFKDFHKRASKDSATGVFAFVDDNILEELRDTDNTQGLGGYTNLSGRRLIDRLFEQGKITGEQRNILLHKQRVNKSFKSAVLDDIKFQSEHAQIIAENIAKLRAARDINGNPVYISNEMQKLYDDSINKVITDKYNGKESDGQGKCTFDFYRIMSVLTSQWSDEQEVVYGKIIDYNHYDELADEETDPIKRAEYIAQRDAVGYDPLEAVYFPPKKFQYAGPMLYERTVKGQLYATAPPIFDKFSLQPLIPTVIKKDGLKTTDWYLARKMEINGIGYVKFESGSKVETPKEKDTLYEGYDPKDPSNRIVKEFSVTSAFKSEQTLFFNHLKEQVTIDAEIHDHAIFGSQIRKLILMNLDKPEFQGLKDRYVKYIGELAELEKTSLYNEMGITRENGRLKINDFGKIVEYFFTEIAKKNQDSNVKKALKYDETTGRFDIPLDAAVQAQVLEGIIISAINNRIVRYKTNGSMLIQMAITGSERARLSSDDSAKALEQYGNENLNYFTVKEGVNGEPTITTMDVKIALTGQWLKLLELNYKGAKIGSIKRLNEAIRDEEWLRENKKAITLVAYRIPTQGRNFLDVMTVKEFLPAAVGDAIVMPKEVVIKSGSDFDIDKMFVFYPNLDKNGKYISYNYDKSILNEDLESKKNDIVSDLNYLKLARRTTLQSLNEEFKVLQLGYKRALRKDTNARRELNKLLRRVETIMAVLDAEATENNRTALSAFAGRNAADNSVLSNLIRSNISYNLAEHEQWMQENGENIYNPMMWVDTKREGLATLRDSIENLYNSDVDYLKLTRDQNKAYIDNLNTDLQTEISHVYDKLYAYNHIKENIQNKLYETMQEVILHPANYMELVTPSDNFHVMPILDEIFEKLGMKEPGKDREPTDYKNTRILERQRNYEKFISLLKGKADLGIAAVANTFNVMLQLAKAGTNDAFLYNNNINTFFFNVNDIEKSGTRIRQINFDSKFDEDGILKSEFFSEFINAFVDVAKDDYVFAANVVTELSPVMFYMKFAGMSSKKILNFINQPGIRAFTKNLSTYQNKFAKLNGLGVNESARKLALKKTLVELGYSGEVNRADIEEYIIAKGQKLGIVIENGTLLYKNIDAQGNINYTPYFSDEMLLKGIRPDGFEIDGNKEKTISPLSERGKLVQVAMLLELENQRRQSNSVTEAQKFLNFDTNPFSSTYDIYSRNDAYEAGIRGNNILSPETLENIKKNSIISSLDMSKDMRDILEALFPVRNNREFNEFLSSEIDVQKQVAIENNDYFSDDDAMKLARTAKNDYMTYILQNFIGYSDEGMKFFHSMFDTNNTFNEYMTELVQTSKLKNELSEIKSLPEYERLCEEYPFIRNIVIEIGENNKITSFRLVENSSNHVEKESVIRQFEDLVNIEDSEEHPESKKIRTFFRNLALYSMFQSGMNTSDISYTNVAPVSIVNKLYGAAVNEYNKLNDLEKSVHYPDFYRLFVDNNPTIFKNASKATPILDTNNRGKWYSKEMPLKWQTKKEEPEPKKIIPVIENVVVNPKGGIKVISQDDVAAYHAYLQKSNGKIPKEFFTSNTTFKEFYNPATGRREKAPQSSKWILQDNGLYNLIDKDGGELYIEDVDLRTGIKMIEPVIIETARTIYDKLGNKTQSENVILPKDLEENTEYSGKNFWDKIVPEAKDMYDNKTIEVNGKFQKTHMLIAYRGAKKKTFLQNYKDSFTVGNPFDWQTETGTREEQGIKSTKRFIHWMITGDNMGVTGATEEYRQAIINDIKSGKIKQSPILYYQEKEYATHATALDYLINKYNWSDSNQPVIQKSPGTVLFHYTTSKKAAAIRKEGYKTNQPAIFTVSKGQDVIKGERKSLMSDVIYLTRDDKRWKKAENIYIGEGEGNEDYTYFDYTTQKYVTLKNAAKSLDLEKVEFILSPDAKVYTIDSLNKFDKEFEKAKKHYVAKNGKDYWMSMESEMGMIAEYAKDMGYDVFNIKDDGNWIGEKPDKYGNDNLYDSKTGNSGKNDFFVFNKNVLSSPESSVQQPTQTSNVKGINIRSDKQNPNSLANRLTNPNWYSSGLMDVEAPYKAGKTGVLKDDMNLMYRLQVEKFKKNPELIDEINARGGLDFIKNSSHEVGVKGSRWEGKGMDSNFIKVLAMSYAKAAKDLGKFVDSAAQDKQTTAVNSQVNQVFESNPELASIGTSQQYSQYLNDIFPDSEVKDIVYHSSPNKIEKFRESMFGTYFSYSPIEGTYGDVINKAILNIKNPLIKPNKEDSTEIKEVYNKEYRAYNDSNKYDASIETSTVTKEGVQIKVKNPEQIHILGSKEDLEGFKKFVLSKKATTTDKFGKKNIFTVTPIQAADKKAKAKASIATQFIGFGEGISGSSTETYRQQAGQYANTGNYSSNDVVFVSVPGKRGDAAIAKREQDKTIKEAIKAIEAGATIITDNKAYTEASTYNTGEQRLYKNLEAKGYTYSEVTVDGQVLGVWNKSTLLEEKKIPKKPFERTFTPPTRDAQGNVIFNKSTTEQASKVEISKVNYTKETPSDKSKGFFFTENLQAYLDARGRLSEERSLPQIDVTLNVTANNNQAGIRTTTSGLINKNAFAIISKKYQQKSSSGSFIKQEGQFQDTNSDFELFKKYNTEAINEALAYGKPLVISAGGIATGKSALPLRFAQWLNNELKTKLGIQGEIKENTAKGYEGYGIFNLSSQTSEVESETSSMTDKIAQWIEKEIPWTVTTPHSELAEMYEKEKLSGQTIEEFLNALSCLGKLI